MLGIVRRMLRKETTAIRRGAPGDARRVKHAAVSFARKENYETWDCGKCGKSFFYAVRRCPSCESTRITARKHVTSGLKDFQYGQVIVERTSMFKTNGVL